MSAEREGSNISWTRIICLLTGLILFFVVYYSPPWPDAVDPMGKHFALSNEGKGALAVFLLAGTWWVFEVTAHRRHEPCHRSGPGLVPDPRPEEAFKDFMDPSVMFIFASVVIGLVFTKTGLTRRLAYKMLIIVGERTSMIFLGCFRGDRRSHAHHGPHRRGGDRLSPLPGHLCPLRRRTTSRPNSERPSSSAWPTSPAPAASSPCWVRPAGPWLSAFSRNYGQGSELSSTSPTTWSPSDGSWCFCSGAFSWFF